MLNKTQEMERAIIIIQIIVKDSPSDLYIKSNPYYYHRFI
jgi:hypothetical protein